MSIESGRRLMLLWIALSPLMNFLLGDVYFDDLEVKNVLAFEKGLQDHLKSKYADLVARI